MQVLVLNGSPRGERTSARVILDPFVDGMKKAGASVETLHLQRLNIKPCLGDLGCWFGDGGSSGSGGCIQDDDMADILPKVAASDVLVLATPVYVDGMTGTLKTALERLVPLVEPFFEIRDGHCRHPLRAGVKAGKIALAATCGFTELDNFAPLIAHVDAAARNLGREYVGALLRPYAGSMEHLRSMGVDVDGVVRAAAAAGEQLATTGYIEQTLLDEVARELVPRELYVQGINEAFRRQLARG